MPAGRRPAVGCFGLLLPLLLVPLYMSVQGVSSAVEDVRISCFVMGGAVSPSINPFSALCEQDPLFIYSAYPLNPDLPEGQKRKLDRIYFPRTRQVLIDSYDFVMFWDARIQHLKSRQLSDLDHAFREAGIGSATVHGPSWEHAWTISTLYQLSPVSDFQIRFYDPWRVSFRREREEVFTPFAEMGMERVIGGAYGIMEPKQGSTVWADMRPQDVPWLTSWKVGSDGGVQWVFADKSDVDWWGLSLGSRGNNPYAIDLVANLLLHSLERPLIGDILARREARSLLSTFQARKLLILTMLEWAERFGADITSLADRLTEVEGGTQDAVESFLERDYDSTISFMDSLSSTVSEIGQLASDLKDQALFWVYLVEWLAVTSVSILSASILWALMVRRKMYHAARQTRLTRI